MSYQNILLFNQNKFTFNQIYLDDVKIYFLLIKINFYSIKYIFMRSIYVFIQSKQYCIQKAIFLLYNIFHPIKYFFYMNFSFDTFLVTISALPFLFAKGRILLSLYKSTML